MKDLVAFRGGQTKKMALITDNMLDLYCFPMFVVITCHQCSMVSPSWVMYVLVVH